VKVDLNIDVKTIAAFMSSEIAAGPKDKVLKNITSDSRVCNKESLFIPIKGEKFDGHSFIKDLCEKQSIGAYITEDSSYINNFTDIPVISCNNTLHGLGLIAKGVRRKINPRVIGITGTNGKTTTKEILAHILKYKFNTHRNEKNYNNEIGVPFTLLKMNEDCEAAVIEMGMNHLGEIERLTSIVEPDIAIITSIGEGHLEFLESIENVARAKAEIMKSMKPGSTVFINNDTDLSEFLVSEARSYNLKAKTFGLDASADIFPETYSLSEDSISLSFNNVELTIPLYGIHNISNVVASVSVAQAMGMNLDEISESLESFENVDGRSAVINHGYKIIDDTYNANPLSTKRALESIMKIYPEKRKIAILSDMKELGSEESTLHELTGCYAAECSFDYLLLWGDMSSAYKSGALNGGMSEERVHIFGTKDALVRYLKSIIDNDDVVLIKGSRSMKMEEVVRAL